MLFFLAYLGMKMSILSTLPVFYVSLGTYFSGSLTDRRIFGFLLGNNLLLFAVKLENVTPTNSNIKANKKQLKIKMLPNVRCGSC